MCNTGDDGLRDMLPDRSALHSKDCISETPCKCNKCENMVNVIYKLKFRQPECRDCFLAYVCHKFRATLGSSKILPRGAKVLLVFDGSAEAVTLLDMLYCAQNQNGFKRLNCSADIVYIDAEENGVTSIQQRHEKLLEVRKFLSHYPELSCYVVPLMNSETNELTLYNINQLDSYLEWISASNENTLATNLTNLRSLSARQDYVKQCCQRLIATVATQLYCEFVFLSDISTTVAAQLLSSVALGRGGSLSLDVALLDDRFLASAGVHLIRPIRDLTQHEIELYLHAKQLLPLKAHSISDDSASIQNLTKAFVDGLQQNYNSTVSTVFRTGNKVASHIELSSSNCENRCAFCEVPLGPYHSSTLLAIEFSRFASRTGQKLNAEHIVHTPRLQNRNGDNSNLCHACENIQNEATNKIFST